MSLLQFHELSLVGLITASSPPQTDWVVAIGPKTTTNDPECSPCYDWAVVSDGLKVSREWRLNPLPKRITPRSPCHCCPLFSRQPTTSYLCVFFDAPDLALRSGP